MTLNNVERFAALFTGSTRGRGGYTVGKTVDVRGKCEGRAITKTDGGAAREHFAAHLLGKDGLGVIPIRDDGTCLFAVIDVDVYDGLDLPELEARIKALNLPLIVCRSKSGGAHLFLFLSNAAESARVRALLAKWLKALGFASNTEIFPKQISLDKDGGPGNWINAPFFDAERTTRYAIKDGKAISLDEFLTLAENTRTTLETAEAIEVPDSGVLADGPPCLQAMVTRGIGEGERNKFIFNLGVYARLRFSDDWKAKLEEYNHDLLPKPLKAKEVLDVISSLSKKKYFYTCNEVPFCDVCKHSECKGQKYGIGGTGHKDPDEAGITIKERIARLRELPKVSPANKTRLISDVVLNDLRSSGAFYRTNLQLYYFDNNEARLLTIGSVELRAMINDRFDINGSERDWTFLLEELQTEALVRGVETAVHRFTHYAGGVHYLYAGANRVFRTDADGAREVLNGTDGILFLNPDMQPVHLPDPANRSTRRALLRVLRVPRFMGAKNLRPAEERKLYAIWCLSLLFGALMPTRALLLLYGPKGSGKTSALRAVLHAVQGGDSEVVNLNRDKEDDYVAAVTNSHLLVLDNVDGFIKWLPNQLAVAATGGSAAMRVLYKTNELVKFPIKCFVCMTSREPQSFTRDDVADRLLVLSVDRRLTFMPEAEMKSEIERLRPAIWAEMLDLVHRMVLALQTHKPVRTAHRLADFASFAIVAGPVIGIGRERVERLLESMDAEKVEFALEHDNLCQALIKWMSAHGAMKPKEWIDTGTLYKELADAWQGDDCPVANSVSLGKKLPKRKADFASYVVIEGPEDGRDNKKLWRITPGPMLKIVAGGDDDVEF